MILYHASKNHIPTGVSLKTKTGRNDGNILYGGAVYLTDTAEGCKRYGTVYVVTVVDAIPYKDALRQVGRTKKSRYARGVYIAKPENTIVLGRYLQ